MSSFVIEKQELVELPPIYSTQSHGSQQYNYLYGLNNAQLLFGNKQPNGPNNEGNKQPNGLNNEGYQYPVPAVPPVKQAPSTIGVALPAPEGAVFSAGIPSVGIVDFNLLKSGVGK